MTTRQKTDIIEVIGRSIQRNPGQWSLLGSVSLLLALVGLDAATGTPPNLRLLYAVPIWLGTRAVGLVGGIILAGVAAIAAFNVDFAQGDALGSRGTLNVAIGTITMIALVCIYANADKKLSEARNTALRDPLTGLQNRHALKSITSEAIARAKRNKRPLVMVMVDCDDFKSINDQHGHAVGDRVLRALAAELEYGIKPRGTIVRTGGDEFVAILMDVELDEAKKIMDKIRSNFGKLMREKGYSTSLTYGMARFGPHGFRLSEMLEAADQDMYRRKSTRARALAEAYTGYAAVR